MNCNSIIVSIKSVLVTLISVFFVGKFNIMQVFSCIPEESKFTIGLSVYCVIVNSSLSKLYEHIYLNNRSYIECLFYTDKHSKSISNLPTITFIEDVTFINCKISVKGKSKRLCRNSLVISLPEWVDVDDFDNSILAVSKKNEIAISLDKIICKSNEISEWASVDIKIGLIRNQYKGDFSIIITPRIKKSILMKFTSNKFNLHD